MARTLKAGFIGVGNQGAPIARRIAGAGFPLGLWARRSASLAPFDGMGVTTYGSPRSLAEAIDIVGLCVVNDEDVRDVVLRPDGVLAGMREGGIIAVHSTVLPNTVIALAAAVAEKGVHLLDAPVSGGPAGASAGTMTIMAGGEPAILARAEPVLRSFASTIAHLGPVGAGQRMKLLNNNLCYANMVMAVYALEAADRLGMSRQAVIDVIRASSGASQGFSIVSTPAMLAKATGPTSNIAKDASHYTRMLAEENIAGDRLAAVSATAAAAVLGLAGVSGAPPKEYA